MNKELRELAWAFRIEAIAPEKPLLERFNLRSLADHLDGLAARLETEEIGDLGFVKEASPEDERICLRPAPPAHRRAIGLLAFAPPAAGH